MGGRRRIRPGARRGERGLGLVELALVLVVVAIVGVALYAYFASTAKTLETVQEQRPLAHARLIADRATLASIRSALQVYYGREGRWPESRDAVAALLSAPPVFQCGGNGFSYDATSGQVALLIDDASRC